MTPELHRKAKQLFLEVCDREEHARRAYLDERCGDDPALRAEVESLLQFHVAETLICPPAGDVSQTGNATGAVRWQPGSMVADRYRICQQLGRGGMGEVYRAEDTLLSRHIALKFITAGRGTDPLWLSRFHSEARIASSVTHRHVCRIHDMGAADGEAFISMEYIDGENLDGLLRQVGRLTSEKAAELARQLCLGLAAIHEQGLLHQDLKPANVMIDARGEVRITDFGIATEAELAQRLVSRAGTPRYMAPELGRGRPATVQSDLYSLGLILYEMVTGRRAFDAEGSADRSLSPGPAPPGEWAPDLDSRLEQTILRCLEPDPDHRPRSAYDVLASLPGGEVLAAVVAAGQTPSVEVVAGSSVPASWNHRAVARIGVLVAGFTLLAVFLLAGRTMLVSYAGLVTPPDVLADRCAQVLALVGCDPTPHRKQEGFTVQPRRWQGLRATLVQHEGASEGLPMAQDVIGYRYVLLNPLDPDTGPSTFLNLSTPATAVARVVLNGRGELRELDCPTVLDVSARRTGTLAQSVDWEAIFRHAGLDLQDFSGRVDSQATATPGGRVWESSDRQTRVEATEQEGRLAKFVVTPSLSLAPTGPSREAGNRLVIRMGVTRLARPHKVL